MDFKNMVYCVGGSISNELQLLTGLNKQPNLRACGTSSGFSLSRLRLERLELPRLPVAAVDGAWVLALFKRGPSQAQKRFPGRFAGHRRQVLILL